MNQIQTITQAYSQTPWRKQVQMIGLFLLVLVSAAVVAGVYLNVTTRTTSIGREIQSMELHVYGYYELTGAVVDPEANVPIEELEQNIASLQAQLAYLTSYQVMVERAHSMGLQDVDPEEIVYMEVAGYVQPQPAILAPPPQPVVVSAVGIDPAFKESLFDWVSGQFRETLKIFDGIEP
jgi:cell division protein FtsL